jgi:S1-C subfamily serine protease
MDSSMRSRTSLRCVLLWATVMLIGGCGSEDPAFEQINPEAEAEEHPTTQNASGAPQVPHHEDNGLSVSEDLPQGDEHPATLTAQQTYALGEKSVFLIEGRRPDEFVSSGTGFLVDKDGGMGLTNAHVVQGLAAISGRFNTGEKGSLHVIATDPCTDLAVVHFSTALPEHTESLIMGKSAEVKPGDSVTVLGYPPSSRDDSSEKRMLISSGLVNAIKVTARPPGLPEYEDTIQHGAPIHQGNSGGPLLDHHGRVVGINTLAPMGSANGSAQGQYYSISIDSAKPEIVDQLLKGQSQNEMGWAAEEYYPGYFAALDPAKGPRLDEQIAAHDIEGGLYVKAVTPGSGASKAGIKPGMLITRLQNTPTNTVAEMCDIAESILPGAVAAVEGIYLRADPKNITRPFYAEFPLPGKH